MSQAIKCDRCGKYVVKTKGMLIGIDRNYDLCDECWNSFGQWVDNKPEPAVAQCQHTCKCEKPRIAVFGEDNYCGVCGLAFTESPPWPEPSTTIVHGVNCPKVEHEYGMMRQTHGNTDDGPYEIGAGTYCGRCHEFLGPTGATAK